ncbi:geranylgeranyl transferase type-2 subunit alpha [Plodia interpunctella]|uniref:geranylgeranyl transferase type-2 subunit alpha n=1 Tax=Plodia interpunctella TaxID=58824 RepID=UPI002367B90F|nr:geranylgeranyl transferase type-2 subunit alpha [Plodia interpunctella]
MHGRVKVRTSEEEKARKEKERHEKLKIFKHAMHSIQTKRNQGELDKELLEITGKVLSSNPDIYTLWNIRREILIVFRKNVESDEDISKLYDDELYLTEHCLKINPKSYCAWHQREWVLAIRPDPDWKKEVTLCNTYLKLDERNFHTWDYRRFVISKCKPSLNEEFVFTTEKLFDNFSNYSAWHYRSKMLVALYPDLEGGRPIDDQHHKHELKMVESAAFTDPDDTSAWFYQRWLLGAVKTTVEPVVCTVTPIKTTVAFNKHVSKNFIAQNISLVINDVLVPGEWISCSGNEYDLLWLFKHNETVVDNLDVKILYLTESNEKETIYCNKYKQCSYIGKNKIDFQLKYSEPVIEELNKQLDSCRQLLALEPDSKWTMLTTTFLLHCLDAKQHYKEVLEKLETLKKIDVMRAGYYSDLKTKWSIEEQIADDYQNDRDSLVIRFNEKITYLPHLQYYNFCETVDFSNQNLTSNMLHSLVMLQHCKNLNLENNKLTTLQDFPLLDLDVLNVQGNHLQEEEVRKLKEKCNYKIKF